MIESLIYKNDFKNCKTKVARTVSNDMPIPNTGGGVSNLGLNFTGVI
jgi:hypothetical protein